MVYGNYSPYKRQRFSPTHWAKVYKIKGSAKAVYTFYIEHVSKLMDMCLFYTNKLHELSTGNSVGEIKQASTQINFFIIYSKYAGQPSLP